LQQRGNSRTLNAVMVAISPSWRYASMLARWFLGLLFIVAGLSKVSNVFFVPRTPLSVDALLAGGPTDDDLYDLNADAVEA
jgi:uncharacterized membrane protein YphA (DoxX/SURF4 family)